MEWLYLTFDPQVEEYIREKQLPLKCLLAMDNATAYPQSLDDDLPDWLDFIKVKFLPRNATHLLHPMDQQVISNFKGLYIRALFPKCFVVTDDTQLLLWEF